MHSPVGRRAAPVFSAPLLKRLTLFATLLAAPAALSAADWPLETADLHPDPAWQWGTLPNGLRYVVRSNVEPAGRVFLILRVQSGSIYERDDQRGFAHFVEHMAFNGTTRYPGTTLVDTMQRAGYRLGAHLSAFTGYTSTFYQLDVPRTDEATLRQAFEVLVEFAQNVTFAPSEVKREFGVVESERRAHTSTRLDYGWEIEEYLFPQTRFAARSVLGETEQLRRATPEALRTFYRTWYRPSRLALIAVGDAPREQLVALVTRHFGPLAEPAAPPPPEPDLGRFAHPDRPEARYIATHEPGGMTNVVYSVRPNRAPLDTRAAREAAIARSAVDWMLHERLQVLVRDNPVAFGQAQAGSFDFFQSADVSFLQISTQTGLWRRGITTLDEELRRALAYGFSDDEVEAQRVRFAAHYQEAIRSAPRTPSLALAQALLQAIEFGFVPTSPADTWAAVEERVRQLTPAECLAALRETWPGDARQFAVLGTQAGLTRGDEIVQAVVDNRRLTPLEDKPVVIAKTLAYPFDGPVPAAASRQSFPEVDAQVVTFPNGVRLALKRTDYQPNHVEVRVRVGYGRVEEPAAKAGLAAASATVLLPGGVGRHDEASLSRILAAESLQLNFQAEEDCYVFAGTASRASLPTLLRLNAAYVLDPALRPAPMFTAMSQLRSYYSGVAASPEQFGQVVVSRLVHAGDHRYGIANGDAVFSHTPEDIGAWIKPILARGPLDLSICGDIDPEATIAEVGRTFGSLPAREARHPLADSLRPRVTSRAVEESVQLAPGLHKTAVMVAWPFDVPRVIEDPRRVRMLTLALQLRLTRRVREELGATYAPESDLWQSSAWPTRGFLYAAVQVEPARARKVAGLVREIAAKLARQGLTPDEFTQIHEPKVASLATELRDDTYWNYYVLPNLGVEPWAVALPLSRTADYRSITVDELNAFARRHLRPELAATLLVTSE